MPSSTDLTVAALTGWDSFEDLLNTKGDYRPTIRPQANDRRYEILADAYDLAQRERGDERRAYRGGGAARLFEQVLVVRLQGVPKGSGQYSEWLKVIHAINARCRSMGRDLAFSTPVACYEQSNRRWFEEYPEFRVVLNTDPFNPDESVRIVAFTDRASQWLTDAVLEVTGHAI